MLIDSEALPDDSVVESDVTIVGSGPAGITLALELGNAGFEVALVESGGPRFSAEAQSLGDTEHFDPRNHAPMSECTRRQIGGASVIWGGRCVPYDPVDFDQRSWVPHSSWPIRFEDLEPYFQRACDYFLCGRSVFDLHQIPEVRQTSIVPGLPDGEVLNSTIARWSLPTDFGNEYSRQLKASPRIRLIHGLTCTEIECTDSRVHMIRSKSTGGKTLRLRSRAYVLACGGIETTRLLLASDRQRNGGIGNHAGHLGRFYMGHVSGRIAQVRFATPAKKTIFGFDRDTDGIYLRRRLSFPREVQRQRQLNNIVAYLANPKISDPAHRNGVLSFSYLILRSPLGRFLAPAAMRNARIQGGDSKSIPAHIRNMVLDLGKTLHFIPTFAYKRYLARRKIPGFYQHSASNVYDLHYHGEQVPNPESRIALVNETDALGLRKVKLDLRYSRQDVDNVVRAHDYWDSYLKRYRVGSLEYKSADLESNVWDQASDGFHQIGTTRMSHNPRDGVVGPQCNVHGFNDLFIASSSTFVTSGQANSTFMIVAFALRLADHLKMVTLPSRVDSSADP